MKINCPKRVIIFHHFMKAPEMRIPVLTYHASTVAGYDYQQNDHVALSADLDLINELGFHVVSLASVIDHMLGRATYDLANSVVLTCDDGCDLEVDDVDYPGIGPQAGFLNIMKKAHASFGWQPTMTSFVIADPDARQKMDKECLHGLGWMSDDWWQTVQIDQYFSLGSHGWDHNHPVLGLAGFDGMNTGSFHDVDSSVRASYQIEQSLHFINEKIKPDRCRYFAYPYGHVPDYLRTEYLPENAARLGLDAAFGTQPGHITQHGDIWNLPRYVCGWHWKSREELKAILLETLA